MVSAIRFSGDPEPFIRHSCRNLNSVPSLRGKEMKGKKLICT